MTAFPRYAIYFAPNAASPLARFGAELLGYDAASGADVPFATDVLADIADWPELTADPRKYGFHGTLKAPFPLADGRSESDLLAICKLFANTPRAIPVITPGVRAISGFTAVVPTKPCAPLNALAQDCVEMFDGFRAPMTAEDRARRKPETLTARQVTQLDRFGYPYIGADFRFHMTLTGRLPADRAASVLALLERRFATLDLTSLAIDRIALFRQADAASRFAVLRSFELTPA
jgi:putative phosphonate metabolism protein